MAAILQVYNSFTVIFLNENLIFSNKILLKYVP